jgi:hypothetical protein
MSGKTREAVTILLGLSVVEDRKVPSGMRVLLFFFNSLLLHNEVGKLRVLFLGFMADFEEKGF